jgi:hypothetical protein
MNISGALELKSQDQEYSGIFRNFLQSSSIFWNFLEYLGILRISSSFYLHLISFEINISEEFFRVFTNFQVFFGVFERKKLTLSIDNFFF